MKIIKKPKTIEEYLSLDKRKCDIIPTMALFTQMAKELEYLRKQLRNLKDKRGKKNV